MSFSQPHRYKLCIPSYWKDEKDEQVCMIMMSSMPSRDDVLDALRGADQLEGYSSDYIDSLRIERPDGWHYKKILIYGPTTSELPLWKFEPAP